jgi:hypothetical protein
MLYQAFSISKNTAFVHTLLLNFKVTWSVSLIHWSVVLWRARKPNCRSQSHIATDGQSISKSWCRLHLGLMTRYLLLSDSYGLFSGAPTLTRGRGCLLYMLLALANVVFVWSVPLGTCDHILLSQIWDFPFRRLLRLRVSRWRYSTPPPHVWRHYVPVNMLTMSGNRSTIAHYTHFKILLQRQSLLRNGSACTFVAREQFRKYTRKPEQMLRNVLMQHWRIWW